MERYFIWFCFALAKQLVKYEELDLEITPKKQKMRMFMYVSIANIAISSVSLILRHCSL
jgi:hypothetical protein